MDTQVTSARAPSSEPPASTQWPRTLGESLLRASWVVSQHPMLAELPRPSALLGSMRWSRSLVHARRRERQCLGLGDPATGAALLVVAPGTASSQDDNGVDWGGLLRWIHVPARARRHGIATRMLLVAARAIGPLLLDVFGRDHTGSTSDDVYAAMLHVVARLDRPGSGWIVEPRESDGVVTLRPCARVAWPT